MKKPILRHIANMWTLVQHPSVQNEWPLSEKLRAIKDAGFDGVCWRPITGLKQGLRRNRLFFLGGMSSGNAADFPKLLAQLKNAGAHHVNVQLADEDTQSPEAIGLALLLMQEGRKFGLELAIETHRDTCTETPEKTYALADAYNKLTGEPLPISWDFSHFAVVKHLTPENFAERLLVRPDLIQRAQQFHFRPFNGHHVQVPVTDGRGKLTPELKGWLPFAEAVLKCWLDGNKNSTREIFVCPELGPVKGGYKLSLFPNSWEDAIILRGEIERLWKKLVR